MAPGEVARLFNEHHGIGVDLEIVKTKGQKRDMFFDKTGPPWLNSPPQDLRYHPDERPATQ